MKTVSLKTVNIVGTWKVGKKSLTSFLKNIKQTLEYGGRNNN